MSIGFCGLLPLLHPYYAYESKVKDNTNKQNKTYITL